MKHCKWCNEDRPIEDFHKHSRMADGRLNKCKFCVLEAVSKWRREALEKDPELRSKEYTKSKQFKNRKYARKHPNPKWTDIDRVNSRKTVVKMYSNKRRATLLNATPAWADSKEISSVFKQATELGKVVDHIVPLTSKLVCGLNTPDNLRIIPPLLNSIKSNVYWSDMPDSTKASKTLMNYRKHND